jgi:hydroxypyruvate isomerase
MPGRITSVDYNSDWALTERYFHAKPAPGYLTREDVIAFYGTLGLAGVELMHSYWEDYPPARLKSLANEAGLPIVSYIFFVDLIAPGVERQGALDTAFALIDRTAELGAPYAMLVAATRPSSAPLSQQRGWLVEGLRACAEHAQGVGVTLLAENIDFPPLRPLMGRGIDCYNLCAEVASPAFRLIYDTAASLFVEEDALETLRVMAPYLAHVHVKNCRPLAPAESSARYLASVSGKLYTGTTPDQGIIHLQPIFDELHRLNYAGYVLLEYQGEEDPRTMLPRSVAYVHSLLERAGGQGHE